MKLYLVRHGETDWNLANKIQGRTDIPLNETGRQQARDLAGKLIAEQKSVERIYCSRQKRALETAQIIAEELGIEAVPKEGLQEMCLGVWEGYSWSQVRERFPKEYEAWHSRRRYSRPPEGESYQQVLDRVLPVLMEIWEEKQREGNILVVTHGAVIMSLFSYFHGTPFEDMARNYKTGNGVIQELPMEELKKIRERNQKKENNI